MKKNYVRLEGNVGFDPRVNTLETGSTVMRLSIATDESYKNRAGELVTETVWHNVVAWESKTLPEFRLINKGVGLIVIGRIKPVQYTTKTGVGRSTYEIVASQILFTADQKDDETHKAEELPQVEAPKQAVLKEETPTASKSRKKAK